jgi:hypothetical protein
LITSSGLIAMFSAMPLLEEIAVSLCSSFGGSSVWSHLPRNLRSIDFSDLPKLTFSASMVFPSQLVSLKFLHCPQLHVSLAIINSLPPLLQCLHLDGLDLECAPFLPQSLVSLWLSDSNLNGGEITLPLLRKVRLGSNLTHDGLMHLCLQSSKIVDVSLFVLSLSVLASNIVVIRLI